jgi:hypothetical protein
MSKKIISYILLLVLIMLGTGSCSKKQGPDTAITKLIGKWKLTKLASDDNNDGVIESYEIHPESAQDDIELLFNNDAVGVEYDTYSGVAQANLNFEWSIIAGDTLQINYKANDSLTYTLVNITSSDLTMTENSKQGLQWFYYVKK